MTVTQLQITPADHVPVAERPRVDRLDLEYQTLSDQVAGLAASGRLTPAIEHTLQDAENRIVVALEAIAPGLRPRVSTGAPRPWHRRRDA